MFSVVTESYVDIVNFFMNFNRLKQLTINDLIFNISWTNFEKWYIKAEVVSRTEIALKKRR